MEQENTTTAIYSLIDEFTEALEDADPVKKGENAGKCVIDADELLDILDEIRIAVPKEVKKAQKLLEEREPETESARDEAEKIILSAKDKADGIVKEALEKADELKNQTVDLRDRVQNSDEVKKAQEKAEQISKEVEATVKQIHNSALEYANTFYADVQAYLESYMNIIAENRRELNDPAYAKEKERRELEEKNKKALQERLMREVRINADTDDTEKTDIPETAEEKNTEQAGASAAGTEKTEKENPEDGGAEESKIVQEKKSGKKRGRPRKIREPLEDEVSDVKEEEQETVPDGYIEGSIVTILKYHNSGYIEDAQKKEYYFDIRDFDAIPEELELGQGVRFKVEMRYDDKKKTDTLQAVNISFNGKNEEA